MAAACKQRPEPDSGPRFLPEDPPCRRDSRIERLLSIQATAAATPDGRAPWAESSGKRRTGAALGRRVRPGDGSGNPESGKLRHPATWRTHRYFPLLHPCRRIMATSSGRRRCCPRQGKRAAWRDHGSRPAPRDVPEKPRKAWRGWAAAGRTRRRQPVAGGLRRGFPHLIGRLHGINAGRGTRCRRGRRAWRQAALPGPLCPPVSRPPAGSLCRRGCFRERVCLPPGPAAAPPANTE